MEPREEYFLAAPVRFVLLITAKCIVVTETVLDGSLNCSDDEKVPRLKLHALRIDTRLIDKECVSPFQDQVRCDRFAIRFAPIDPCLPLMTQQINGFI